MASPERRARSYLLVAFMIAALVAVSHAWISIETAENHRLHVLLRLSYLVPLVLAAVGAGAAGGVAASAAITLVYAAHIVGSWLGLPRENTNQAAFIGVYWLVGPLVGLLVDRDRRTREQWHRDRERRSRQALVDALRALEAALAHRDADTARHGEAVAELALELARRMDLAPDRLELVRLAGRVHDLGKIGVRDDVLYKADKLTPSERERIEAHPGIAADILDAVPGASPVAEIVRAHHEYLDGSGYPRGLVGDEIPLEAQVLTVSDVFCALTEPRAYHDAWSADEALDLLESWAPHRVSCAIVAALRAFVCKEDGGTG